MNVRQLEVLRTMIRTGSVSETARRLGMSQPAASKILGAIELDLGMTLFSRANGRLHTTREAQDLFPEIERMSATWRPSASAPPNCASRVGEVRIASAPVLGTCLPPAMHRFGLENRACASTPRSPPLARDHRARAHNQIDGWSGHRTTR
jgi:DNA-binding transcriptional LysR family regulator